jgi:crotonobetainyl-CoA:carnitine CoA-transferase CaiB-like acyl-CoA transferase
MVETQDPRGTRFKVPGLPLEMDGARPGLRSQPPAISQDARELLASLGYAPARIEALIADKVVAAPQ